MRTAKPSEITAAYHLLARRYHPDMGAEDAASLAQLKLINEAYEVLSDAVAGGETMIGEPLIGEPLIGEPLIGEVAPATR